VKYIEKYFTNSGKMQVLRQYRVLDVTILTVDKCQQILTGARGFSVRRRGKNRLSARYTNEETRRTKKLRRNGSEPNNQQCEFYE